MVERNFCLNKFHFYFSIVFFSPLFPASAPWCQA